jgi:mannose-6-phosphate isomerase-like protein (cupin superfamily)
MVTDEQHRTSDPVHRVSMAFERDGGSLWVTSRLQDGGHLPEHFHPTLVEHWEVVEGAIDIKLAGTWRPLAAGDGRVTVERNFRHELKNASGRGAVLRTEVTPPGRLEEFLRESAWAAQEGLYNARNLPRSVRGALWIAEFAHRFADETVMTSPPPALQRILLPPLAKLARGRAPRP